MKNRLLLIRQIFLFGIVGVIGFIIDSGVLYFSKELLGIYLGRLLSFLAAVFSTWILNRNITFNIDRKSSLIKEFLYYFGCMILGGITNLVAYYILIENSDFVREYPIIAVAVGSVAGMLINFATSKWIVFKKKDEYE